MPRILPSAECPKCHGPLKRTPGLLGALYSCERCDADDPIEGTAKNWLDGELRPPAGLDQPTTSDERRR
jgi:hypothetical protein